MKKFWETLEKLSANGFDDLVDVLKTEDVVKSLKRVIESVFAKDIMRNLHLTEIV